MTVCAEAATGEQALALFRTHRPHVTLMDQRLPGMSGSEATHAIRAEFPDARIIVLSTYVCDEEIYTALQFGAMAYLAKSVQREELHAGNPEGQRGPAAHHAGGRGAAGRWDVAVAPLRPRARRAPAAGRRQAEPQIASVLDITEGTVKLHVSNILGKLAVADRTEAVTVALQRGIIQLETLRSGQPRDMSFDISRATPSATCDADDVNIVYIDYRPGGSSSRCQGFADCLGLQASWRICAHVASTLVTEYAPSPVGRQRPCALCCGQARQPSLKGRQPLRSVETSRTRPARSCRVRP